MSVTIPPEILAYARNIAEIGPSMRTTEKDVADAKEKADTAIARYIEVEAAYQEENSQKSRIAEWLASVDAETATP